MPTYRELLGRGRERLKAAEIADWNTDAWLLLEYVFDITRSQYFLMVGDIPGAEKAGEYEKLLEKRSCHIPLQHLTGEAWFYGRSFYVNDQVLIPRQDTELLVESAVEFAHCYVSAPRILDMCTGSGCILLSLLGELESAVGMGADISEGALKVAVRNAERLDIKAEFIRSDLFDRIEGSFDMILSNPPYIQSKVIDSLMPEVRDHEPLTALDGKEDGLYFYKRIIAQAGAYLNAKGLLAFEIGYDQGEAVEKLLEEAGFADIEVRKDLAGLDRVVLGRKKQEENDV